jgi:hypothetical protein
MHLELFISVFHPCFGQVTLICLAFAKCHFWDWKEKNVEGEKVGRVIDRKKKCCEINSRFDHMGG